MEQITSTEKPASMLTLREKIAYFICGTGLQPVLMSIENFMLYFYTDVLGIGAAIAGSIGLVISIWDGVNDPLIANFIDNRTFKNGEKIRPLLKYFTIPFVVLFALMFIAPDMSLGMKVGYALVVRLLYETISTVILVPMTSLNVLASPLREDRVIMGQNFTLGSLLGTGIMTVAFWPLVALFGGIGGREGVESERLGFPLTMALFVDTVRRCAVLFLPFLPRTGGAHQ